METKSRVIKYEKYRKKISKIDTYSSDENTDERKHLSDEVEVKTNSLSLSIDDLLSSDEAYKEKKKKEETKKKYKEKKKEVDRIQGKMTKWKLLVIAILPFVLIFATLLILVLLEVI